MVDRTDIPQLNSLFQRYRSYQDAMAVFDHDARIISFTLQGTTAGEDGEGQWPTVTVDAEGIASPPQMLTAIKDQIEQRIKHINEQLTELGVAEASAAPAAAPAPRAAPAPHKPEPHKPSPRNTRR